MQVYDNILKVVGKTPLVRINKLTNHVSSNIYGKMESLNPGGSIKDRIGLYIIDDAEQRGLLKPGGTIVEATSGNTGFGLAIVAAVRGYKTIFVMPDKMSQEKIQNLRAFGAKVIITPTDVAPEDPRSYYSVSRKIAEETPNAFYADQYHNPQNPLTHYERTGPEIWDQMDSKIDTLVVGLGTGGTVSGIGKFLKEKNPKIKVVGVDPIGSIYYEFFRSKKMGQAHTYKVEGIGEDFIPSTIDFRYIDDVIRVTDKECFQVTRRLLREEGIFVGGSSGGAMAGAIKYAETVNGKKEIVVIFPDSGDRYLSKVFNDDWMRENGFLDSSEDSGSAREILDKKSALKKVVTGSRTTKIIDVVRTMKELGISQVPIVEGEKIIGIVTEAAILHYLSEPNHRADNVIDPVMSQHFEQVSLDDSLESIFEYVKANKTVIVSEGGKIHGVITKIDLLSYYSRKK